MKLLPECRNCKQIGYEDEVCQHGHCQDCRAVCCNAERQREKGEREMKPEEELRNEIDLVRWTEFACELQLLRVEYPEYAKEIDKCIYDVGQKIKRCDDPNCTCRMSFENFHAISNQNAQAKI